MIDHDSVAAAADRVRERIVSAGGSLEQVRIIAVTKGFGAEAVDAALAAGIADIGESYAQELQDKSRLAGGGPRWHFIGRLQSNKVRLVADVVHLWHSVDRRSLVAELARRAPQTTVLVQVDVTGEPQKGGCAPTEVSGLVADLRGAGVAVAGLMAIGPLGPPEDARAGFRLVSELADGLDLPERSMGMSDDLEVAVSEGATMVRVGRALFGARPER